MLAFIYVSFSPLLFHSVNPSWQWSEKLRHHHPNLDAKVEEGGDVGDDGDAGTGAGLDAAPTMRQELGGGLSPSKQMRR